jgi:wobble nucleotide-excising tRNase
MQSEGKKMLIKKIDINNFGVYKNFVWDKTPELEGLNILYGSNASGKTTLSRIIQILENVKDNNTHNYNLSEFYEDYDVKITFANEKVIEINKNKQFISQLSSIDSNFRVYNADFIKDNFSVFYNKSGNITPFVGIGKSDKENQERILAINQELGDDENGLIKDLKNKEETYKQQQNYLVKKNQNFDNSLTNIARVIRNSSKFHKPSYTRDNLKKDSNDNKNFVLLEQNQIDEYETILQSEIKKQLDEINLVEQSFSIEGVFELCKTVITPSKIIESLKNDSEMSNWVEQGIKLHRNNGLNTCSFCNNSMEQLRFDELDQHFTQESNILKQKITHKITEIKSYKDKLQNISYIKEQFEKILQEEFEKQQNICNTYMNNYKKLLDRFIQSLEDKQKNLYDITNINIDIDLKNILINELNCSIMEINKIIKQHNDNILNINNRKDEAREKLFKHTVVSEMNKIYYDDTSSSIEILNGELSTYKTEKNEVETRIKLLQQEKKDIEEKFSSLSLAKDSINEYLKKYFSRYNLKIDIDIENKHFIVKRNADHANHLSEGECSLISFCYFLAKIKTELDNNSNLIIWIDDPISSLDNNNIFSLFRLIQDIISQYKQLFISTHNLEFLKYLKRLDIPKGGVKTERFIIEKSKDTAKISKMPKYLENCLTEFNYLFEQIYNCATNSDYDDYYNFGNNLRKFLECYLYFKYPNLDKDLDKYKKFFGDDASAINRLANEQSHLPLTDRLFYSTTLVEMKECAKKVINKIKEKDEEQYEALYASINENKQSKGK